VRIEDVSLAQHEVHEEVCIVQSTVATAVQNGTQRQAVQFLLVRVAVPCIGLVFGTDVPIHALVPLEGVVRGSKIYVVIVVGKAVVGIWRGIKIQNVLSDRIDLVRAENVRLAVAAKRLVEFGGVWLIEGDRLGRPRQILVQQFREIALPHQGCWNGRDIRTADRNPIHFEISKVKHLVAPDWSTKRRSELVLVVRRGG